jgi:hypothetical protein
VKANRAVVDDLHRLRILVQQIAPGAAIVLVAPFDVIRRYRVAIVKFDPAAQPKGGAFCVFSEFEALRQRRMVVVSFTKVLDQRVLQRHQEIVRAGRAVMLLRVEPARRDVGVPR